MSQSATGWEDELRKKILAARILLTHLLPDPDALSSIELAQRVREKAGIGRARVRFAKAYLTGVDEDELALDMGQGYGLHAFGKGHSFKAASEEMSCSLAVLQLLPKEAQQPFQELVQAISMTDSNSGRRDRKFDFLRLHPTAVNTYSHWRLLEFWTHYFKELRHNPNAVLPWDCEELQARAQRHYQAGVEAAKNAEFFHGGKFAVLPHNSPPSTSTPAFQAGAVVVLFSADKGADRYNLGLSRDRYMDSPHLGDVFNGHLENFPEIFVHQQGYTIGWAGKSFLFCSKKDFWDARKELITLSHKLLGPVFQVPRRAAAK